MMDDEIVLPGVTEHEKREGGEHPKGFVSSPDQTIVIHPGSAFIRLGRSSDYAPQTVAHHVPDPYFSATASSTRDGILQKVEATELHPLRGDTKPQKKRQREVAPSVDVDVVHESEEPDPYQYTDVSAKPAYVFGEKALRIRKSEPYCVVNPFFRGGLNVSPTYPLQQVVAHIALLWRHLFTEKLGIKNLKDLENYAVLVLVPDMFDRRDLREIANILTRDLRCKAFTFFQESVACTFGAGLATACVVDIGDQKISVSCVEEGVSLPHSRIQMSFGGRDVTRFLLWLLLRNGFPHKTCSMNDMRDVLMLNNLKETISHLRGALTSDYFDFTAPKEGTTRAKRYRISISECLYLAPLTFFAPTLLEPLQMYTGSWPSSYDAEEIFDDEFVARLVGSKSKAENPVALIEPNQSTVNSIHLQVLQRRMVVPLDEAVCASIDKIVRRELVKRLYGAIIVVGGGSMVPGLVRALEDRVFTRVGKAAPDVERVEVQASRKDLDNRTVTWRGGAVVANVEGARDFWVRKQDWELLGTRALRERLPFVF